MSLEDVAGRDFGGILLMLLAVAPSSHARATSRGGSSPRYSSCIQAGSCHSPDSSEDRDDYKRKALEAGQRNRCGGGGDARGTNKQAGGVASQPSTSKPLNEPLALNPYMNPET